MMYRLKPFLKGIICLINCKDEGGIFLIFLKIETGQWNDINFIYNN